MTDKEALLAYRMREAEETLADARTILEAGGSTRTGRTGGDAVKLSNRGNRPCCQDFLLPACGAHDIK